MIGLLSSWAAIFGAVMFAGGIVLFIVFGIPRMIERFGPIPTATIVVGLFSFFVTTLLVTI